MNLFKTSFLSGVETAIKLLSGFVVMKFVAVEIGPKGVAFFGQFQNFIAAFIILISGGFTTGLVRYCAQEKSALIPTKNYLGNALGLGLISSLLISGVIFLFAPVISIKIFKTSNYSHAFYILALCSFLMMTYQALIAAFNGWGEFVKLIVCKSLASILLLLSSFLLVNLYGLSGGLISLIVMQSVTAFIAIGLMTRVKNFKWEWLKPRFNVAVFREFFPYWLMSFVTLISTPLILILIRTHIASVDSWNTAGLWEASWKLSELYLLVITTALTTYYVPKLSRAEKISSEIAVVREVLFWGVMAAAILASLMYICRNFVISLLFSSNFSIVSDFLLFQLLGSVVKIAAWVFSYHMLVKRKTNLFLLSELLFGTSFYCLSRVFFDKYGLVGLSYAYFINYIFYFLFCSLYFYYEIRAKSQISLSSWLKIRIRKKEF